MLGLAMSTLLWLMIMARLAAQWLTLYLSMCVFVFVYVCVFVFAFHRRWHCCLFALMAFCHRLFSVPVLTDVQEITLKTIRLEFHCLFVLSSPLFRHLSALECREFAVFVDEWLSSASFLMNCLPVGPLPPPPPPPLRRCRVSCLMLPTAGLKKPDRSAILLRLIGEHLIFPSAQERGKRERWERGVFEMRER